MPAARRGSAPILPILVVLVVLAAVVYLLTTGPGSGETPSPSPEDTVSTDGGPAPKQDEAHPASLGQIDLDPGDGGREAAPARTEMAAPKGRAGLIRGTVVDESGQAITGAHVILTERPDPAQFFAVQAQPPTSIERRSDGRGRFVFESLPLGKDFDMWVTHPEYAPAPGIPVTVLSEDQDLKPVVLDKGFTLGGTVHDTNGNPIQAEIQLRRLGGTFAVRAPDDETDAEVGRLRTVTADGNGHYLLDRLSPGSWSIRAEYEGYATFTLPAIQIGNEKNATQDIEMGPEFRISGTVRDADGNPVADARVDVGRTRPRPIFSANTQTDAEGRFTVRGLPKGSYGVSAMAPGFSRGRAMRPVQAGDDDVEITLHPRGAVSGRITETDGSPITRFRLELYSINPGTTLYRHAAGPQDFQDPSGNYLWKDIEPGTYRLLATAPGHAPTYSPGFSVGRETLQGVDFELVQGGLVRATVVDQEGNPISGAEMVLHGRDWTKESAVGLFGGVGPDPNNVPRMSATSGPDGKLELRNAYPGQVRIELKHPVFLSEFSNVEITAGGVVDLGTVRMRRGGVIFGHAVDGKGQPLAGGTVYLTRQNSDGFGGIGRNMRLDAQGRFRFQGLDSGSYKVSAASVSGSGFLFLAEAEGSTKEIFLREGEDLEVVLTVQ